MTTFRQAGWAPAVVFTVHVVAAVGFQAYARYPRLDVPMHFPGGLAAWRPGGLAAWRPGGLATGYFFHHALVIASRYGMAGLDAAIRSVFVFSLVGTTAVIWEFAEGICDHFFQTCHQTSLDDIMLDLALGLSGGAVFPLVRALRRFATERAE